MTDFVWPIGGGSSLGVPEGVPDVDAEGYAWLFLQLLPPHGFAWAVKQDPFFVSLVLGLVAESARIENRARDLIEEADPRTTTELIGDWERVYDLPEECGTPPTTIEGRRAALHAKMAARGVGNRPFFLQLAANLGYPGAVIYRMFDPFVCTSECTHALYGVEGYWVDTFYLQANDTGENDGTLQCLVRAYAQSHEIAIFEAPDDWIQP